MKSSGQTPTNTLDWFRLISDLRAEEVPFAHDENGDYSSHEQWSLHGTQKVSNPGIDHIHLPLRGTVGALDWVVYAFVSIASFPVDLENLVPHGYE